ncbi:hypothetical protein CLOBOL_01794 [Enterocloster bolteae ATCC BAA-613]|uniref:Uncharacterized protein n=1 Tax=Enterocloster bolteae (strain ATCC BAA-613 / DSM 15670 / CCUG 46953 / JCM 12243 / WAL 16351) TaxID=411902 RepID=A8RM09_ENTBW|nr:hypothetical protein CLOBOL_01794 [Enterocloster bolteae ATCC BAA-613]
MFITSYSPDLCFMTGNAPAPFLPCYHKNCRPKSGTAVLILR